LRISAAGEKSVEAARQVQVPRISPAHGRSWVGNRRSSSIVTYSARLDTRTIFFVKG
jgi:hypothetical protein